jgi:predicted sulfurtransferase
MIQNYVEELNNIRTEIIRNNTRNKNLKKRVCELEGHILSYLKEKEQEGVKYKGKAIMVEKKEKFKQNKKLKEEVSVEFFREIGVRDAENVYRKLLEVQRGEAVEKETLKIKTLK